MGGDGRRQLRRFGEGAEHTGAALRRHRLNGVVDGEDRAVQMQRGSFVGQQAEAMHDAGSTGVEGVIVIHGDRSCAGQSPFWGCPQVRLTIP